ncbi:hypothetical protein EON82_09180 [bacterium]|nr:MAG: hypothetical protein EON82_09180 [bacterium]
MRRRGVTLIQLLVGTVLGTVVLGGVLVGFMALWNMQKMGLQMPAVQQDARQLALTIASSLRRATLCTSSDSSCVVDAAAESASSSGITAYRRNTNGSLSKLVYSVSSGNVQVVDAGSTSILAAGGSLTLTFYQAATYHSNSLTTYTPDNTTIKQLIAVGITTSVSRNGLSGSYTTTVRLRNSPKKAAATD